MIPIQVEVEESEYDTFVALLRSLRYVKLAQTSKVATTQSQVERIKAALDAMPATIYQDIKDPLEWQRNIRDEWS